MGNNRSITSDHRSIRTSMKSKRAGIRTQTKTTWKKEIFFVNKDDLELWNCDALVIDYESQVVFRLSAAQASWLMPSHLFETMRNVFTNDLISSFLQWWRSCREKQRNSGGLVIERFKWKMISYFYGNHHWICPCLSKESDIAELRVVEIVVQIRSVGNDLEIWLKLYTEESHSMKRLVNPWTKPFSAGKCFHTLGWPDPSVRRTDHQPPHVYWSGPMGPSASTMSPRTWDVNKKSPLDFLQESQNLDLKWGVFQDDLGLSNQLLHKLWMVVG